MLRFLKESAFWRQGRSVADFLPLDDVRDGLIWLKDGTACAIVEAGSVNYDLLSDTEREAIEAAFISFLMTLTFPIQVFAHTTRLQVDQPLQGVERNLERLDGELRRYGELYCRFLRGWAGAGTLVRQCYVIIPCAAKNLQHLRAEITRRVNVVVGGLQRAGISSAVLGTEEILDLLHSVMNKHKPLRPSKLIAAGALDFLKEGEGGSAAVAQA